MGIKSTHYITRTVAQQIIASKVFSMTDEELESALESFKESYFRNYRIVSEEKLEEDEKSEYPSPSIKHPSEF